MVAPIVSLQGPFSPRVCTQQASFLRVLPLVLLPFFLLYHRNLIILLGYREVAFNHGRWESELSGDCLFVRADLALFKLHSRGLPGLENAFGMECQRRCTGYVHPLDRNSIPKVSRNEIPLRIKDQFKFLPGLAARRGTAHPFTGQEFSHAVRRVPSQARE